MDRANPQSSAAASSAPSVEGVAEQVELAVPRAPWLIATGPRVGLAAAATIGGVLGWQTRRHVLWSAMRQVFVVSLAAGLTFLVGWLLGAAASGTGPSASRRWT